MTLKENSCTVDLDLIPEEIDLNELAHEAVLELLQAAHAEDNTLMISVVGGYHTIQYDPVPISFIISVLISNAIHYTKHGAIILRIATYDDRFVLDVIDSGCGVHPDILPLLLTGDADVSEDFLAGNPPAGFSIKVVNKLVSFLKGTFTIESHYNIGSMFQVTLPLAEKLTSRG